MGRYGGDEFLLFREGATLQNIDEDLAHFQESLARFNAKETLPFHLSISSGSSLYTTAQTMDGPAFIKVLDTLMYENKRLYHAKQTQDSSRRGIEN